MPYIHYAKLAVLAQFLMDGMLEATAASEEQATAMVATGATRQIMPVARIATAITLCLCIKVTTATPTMPIPIVQHAVPLLGGFVHSLLSTLAQIVAHPEDDLSYMNHYHDCYGCAHYHHHYQLQHPGRCGLLWNHVQHHRRCRITHRLLCPFSALIPFTAALAPLQNIPPPPPSPNWDNSRPSHDGRVCHRRHFPSPHAAAMMGAALSQLVANVVGCHDNNCVSIPIRHSPMV